MQTLRRQLYVLIAAALFSACIEKEQPKPQAPPPGPPPEPARSALAVDANGAYTIASVANNKCLQPAGGRLDDGAELQIATCNASKAQQFKLVAVAGGYYSVRNVASGRCLDVQGGSMDDSAMVQHWTCNDGPNQQWILSDADPDTLRIVARHSGKVLDVRGEHSEDGTPVNQYPWKASANQKFKLKAVAAAAPDAGPPKEVAGAGGKGGKGGKGGGKPTKTAEVKGGDLKPPADAKAPASKTTMPVKPPAGAKP